MTDSNDPFADDTTSQSNDTNTQETPAPSSDDLFADKLTKIVNEKGEPKYKDVESALEALSHSQNFIETLKSEKAEIENKLNELSAELDKRESVEDVVKRLTERTNNTAPNTVDQPKEGGLDESKIVDLVNSVLKQQSEQSLAQQNIARVSKTLTETFGDKAKEVIQSKAKEIGSTPQELRDLSASKPELVLKLFGDVNVVDNQSTTSTQNPPRHQQRTLEPPKPDRSLMRGASNKEVMEALRRSKEYTNQRLGVET